MRLAGIDKRCAQQVACLQDEIVVTGEFAAEAADHPELIRRRSLECQFVPVLGKGDETVQEMIAVGPPTRHMQSEVDLGRGSLDDALRPALCNRLHADQVFLSSFLGSSTGLASTLAASDSIGGRPLLILAWIFGTSASSGSDARARFH